MYLVVSPWPSMVVLPSFSLALHGTPLVVSPWPSVVAPPRGFSLALLVIPPWPFFVVSPWPFLVVSPPYLLCFSLSFSLIVQ
jgi:hypothetical protein